MNVQEATNTITANWELERNVAQEILRQLQSGPVDTESFSEALVAFLAGIIKGREESLEYLRELGLAIVGQEEERHTQYVGVVMDSISKAEEVSRTATDFIEDIGQADAYQSYLREKGYDTTRF